MIPTTEIFGGYRVPTEDTHIGKWVQDSGRLDHDQWLLPQLERYIPVGGTVIDVGAYIGDHTIWYSERVGELGKVLAMEPNPDIFQVLVENCKLFKHKNVMVICAGLAHRYLNVTRVTKDANLGATYFLGDASAPFMFADLDDQWKEKVDFIKMDIEGWEFYALVGAMTLIDRYHPVMLIEMNETAMARTKSSYSMIFEFLRLHDYSYRSLQECTLVEPQYDLICTPL